MRNSQTNVVRAFSHSPANRVAAILLLLAVVLGGVGSAARAEEIDAADRARTQKVAITLCGSCHGPQGNSTQPKFPRLAGQNANYLAAQLKAFRSQARGDPDAIAYMWGMAAELDDDTIAALAAYYAAQKPTCAARTDEAAITRGRKIHQNGISAEGVPPAAPVTGQTLKEGSRKAVAPRLTITGPMTEPCGSPLGALDGYTVRRYCRGVSHRPMYRKHQGLLCSSRSSRWPSFVDGLILWPSPSPRRGAPRRP